VPQNGSAAPEPTARPLSDEQIRIRAYEIYLRRGAGDPVADWLEAEAELRG
jgi:hypothetical protein